MKRLAVNAWLAIRPIRKITEARRKKRELQRLEAEAAGGEFLFDDDEGTGMNEQLGSAIRSIGKLAGGVLVGAGLIDESLVEPLIGLALAAASVYASYRAHKAKSA